MIKIVCIVIWMFKYVFKLKKVVMNREQSMKHVARKVLIIQASRKQKIHTRHRFIETGKQTRNVREGD